MQPLTGVLVLDFSTLLPGPLATLLLAEAGAEVDQDRTPGPRRRDAFVRAEVRHRQREFRFAQPGKAQHRDRSEGAGRGREAHAAHRTRGRGGRAVSPGCHGSPRAWVTRRSRRINPRIVYCAITGYGQHGPRADVAAHDLNYVAEAGMLMLTSGADGAPVLPAALVADIAGGTYPAVDQHPAGAARARATGGAASSTSRWPTISSRSCTGGIGNGLAAGEWPQPGGELVTGGSPRYNIYRTRDERFLAAAPLEQKFWENFCALLDLPRALRDDASIRSPRATQLPNVFAHARLEELMSAFPRSRRLLRDRGDARGGHQGSAFRRARRLDARAHSGRPHHQRAAGAGCRCISLPGSVNRVSRARRRERGTQMRICAEAPARHSGPGATRVIRMPHPFHEKVIA